MNGKHYLPILLGLVFLVTGIVFIRTSLLNESTILTFIGLATLFWGSLLLYVRPSRCVDAILLDTTTISSLESLDQLISSLGYEGQPVYLPPQLLADVKSERLFISKNADAILPSTDPEKQQNLSVNSDGLYVIPPGVELTNLFEKKLRKKFIKASLPYLAEYLPRVFIEDLEISRNCEFSIENDLVTAKLTGVVHKFLYQRLSENSTISNGIGCPFSSAIACTLARSSGKPVLIKETIFSKKKNYVQVTYHILGD